MKADDRRVLRIRRLQLGAVIAIALQAWMTAAAVASSVVAMNVPTLSDFSGQVIEGKVVSARSYEATDPWRIETEVVFEGVVYLKGAHPGADNAFKLIVPGGTVGDRQMRICCAPKFDVGGRYLLFLLPTYKTFPTVGLDQGAFEIRRDDSGVDRVFQSGLAVSGLDEDGFVRLIGGERASAREHVVASNHVTVRQPGKQDVTAGGAIALDDFVNLIRPILDRSVDHHLVEAAGKQIPVQLRPTSLKRAGTPGNAGQRQGQFRVRSERGPVEAVPAAPRASAPKSSGDEKASHAKGGDGPESNDKPAAPGSSTQKGDGR